MVTRVGHTHTHSLVMVAFNGVLVPLDSLDLGCPVKGSLEKSEIPKIVAAPNPA